MCRCDGDVICVGHDLNRCSVWWSICSVNGVGEGMPPRGCVGSVCCVGFASYDVVCDQPRDCAWNVVDVVYSLP